MLTIDSRTCHECAGCISLCPDFALYLDIDGLQVRQDDCSLCEICIEFCPVGSLKVQSQNLQT
ncbi:MAG: 4Fe-4S binding protein [Candidatus Zixiibacteriota bacterium]